MITTFLKSIVISFLEKTLAKIFNSIVNYFKERKRKKKLKSDNDKKVDDFKTAETEDEIGDAFDNLP